MVYNCNWQNASLDSLSGASVSKTSSSSNESQKMRARSRHLPQTSQSRHNDARGQDNRQSNGQRGNNQVNNVHGTGKRQDSNISGRNIGQGGPMKDDIDSGYVGSTRSNLTSKQADVSTPSQRESQRTRSV